MRCLFPIHVVERETSTHPQHKYTIVALHTCNTIREVSASSYMKVRIMAGLPGMARSHVTVVIKCNACPAYNASIQ